MYVYFYVCIHVYVCVFVCMYVYAYSHICVCMYDNVLILFMHAYMHIYEGVHVFMLP